MLRLKRKVGESISIGNDITIHTSNHITITIGEIKITITRSTDVVAHYTIDAPRDVPVMRTELLTKAKKEKESNDEETETFDD